MNKLAGKDIENHYFRKRAVRMFALLSAVVCAVIFSAALVLEFDTEKGVYAQNAVFAPLAETAAVLCSLAAAIMCVFIPKEKETEYLFPEENRYDFYFRFDPLPVKAVRYVTALVIFLESLADFVMVSLEGNYLFSPWFEILRLVLAFALALYFVPELADMGGGFFGKAHLYCGSVGCLWFFFTVIKCYFDMSLPIPSHYRIAEHICLILCLLGIMFDIKLRTGALSIKRRLAFLSVGFIVSFGFNFGRLVMLLFGKNPSFFDTVIMIYCLAFSVYFGARLLFYTEE
ncbi:MAG: hypothetical protein IJV70_01245 [Clostridia bacterium]|nr:hypothetical protein [Clostridia bacterium]